MDLIKYVEENLVTVPEYPDFGPGDTVEVTYKIVEGEKVRPQSFRGTIIQKRGHGKNETFTIRKMSHGVGVERIFPIASPNITEIKVIKRGKVRRAKLYYLRQRTGKSARIKEKQKF